MKFSRKTDSVAHDISIYQGRGHKLPLLFIALILITIPAILAADFWEKTEYTKWKDRDCIKMLTDSPWAKSYKESKGSDSSGTLDGSIPFIQYAVRLSSALPVRQATIRRSQIANKYDDLPAEQQQAYDKSANGYLATPFKDVILVQVEYSTNLINQQIPLANHWKTQSTEMLKNSTYLFGSKDVKVQLQEYIPPQENQTSFQFIFPRQLNGQPLLTPEDKSLKLEFDTMSGDRALLEFKVNKMIIDGEVIY